MEKNIMHNCSSCQEEKFSQRLNVPTPARSFTTIFMLRAVDALLPSVKNTLKETTLYNPRNTSWNIWVREKRLQNCTIKNIRGDNLGDDTKIIVKSVHFINWHYANIPPKVIQSILFLCNILIATVLIQVTGKLQVMGMSVCCFSL